MFATKSLPNPCDFAPVTDADFEKAKWMNNGFRREDGVYIEHFIFGFEFESEDRAQKVYHEALRDRHVGQPYENLNWYEHKHYITQERKFNGETYWKIVIDWYKLPD